jgi:hypothetical protein
MMPSQHTHPPISFRPPEHLREWLTDYASRNSRPVRSIVTEALEEYRTRHGQDETPGMEALPTEAARSRLHRIFTWQFLQPHQMAWAPIRFPGIAYNSDGTLAPGMKDKATQHLVNALSNEGCIIWFRDRTDVNAALHHVLWDQWTKDEIGNGRFTGRLFDDHGRIYHGCTAIEAAYYILERLAALGGGLYSPQV